MDIVSSRHALYALISAIETDLRRFLSDRLAAFPVSELLNGSERRKATDRLLLDDPGASEPDLHELLLYLDLVDARSILMRVSERHPSVMDSSWVVSTCADIDVLTPIRHRVAHTRPLLIEDVPTAFGIARKLERSDKTLWPQTCKALRDSRNAPEVFLSLSLPNESDQKVLHNLPAPDFDETGFVGRERELEQIKNLCKGSYPVVTIVGEGGLGKSALALKAAYDLLDDPEDPFEIIIWSSSKTAQLTASEIVRIEGAIESSFGLLQNVELQLVGRSSDDSIREILQYMESFKTLIVLDNLETVLDKRLRDFFGQLPKNSKLLVTSRIGVGAFEYPFLLHPMEPTESRQMLRVLSQVRGVHQLANLSREVLDTYCRRMKNNPGFIKWFVSAVQSGRRPEEVLVKPEIFLDFCMSNVYEHLSSNSIHVLQVLLCASASQTQAEIAFSTEMPMLDLQKSLQQLLTTNMINMRYEEVGDVLETSYQVSELARAFLNKRHPVSNKVARKYAEKRRQITALEEQFQRGNSVRMYMLEHVHCRTRSDALMAKALQDAITLSKKQRFEDAKKLVQRAREMAPDYFEVYRVDAQIAYFEGNWPLAKDLYRSAIEVESNWAPLRYWYAGFMLRNQEDAGDALHELEVAHRIDPESVHIRLEMARCRVYLREFEKADKELRALWKLRHRDTWATRKLVDLTMQLLVRGAEEKIDERDAAGALNSLIEAQQFISKCPQEFIDSRIEQILANSAVTFRRLATSKFSIPASTDLMRAYAEWLHARIGHPGTLVDGRDGPLRYTLIIDDVEYDVSPSIFLGDLFGAKVVAGRKVRAIVGRRGFVSSMIPDLSISERWPSAVESSGDGGLNLLE